tara:strand:+ start:7271 stop:7717 length:447 start_codon:yes stop_codon:yes gene_type:complete
MEIEESNIYGPLKIEDLEKFEMAIGHRLPDDYRKFLIEHNGGTPEKYLVCWPGSDEPSEVWNDTMGLHDGPTYSRLNYAYEGIKEYLPDGILPFASDPGGNYFCIGFKGDFVGKIYFWDHERSDSSESIELLSNSFNEFVLNLVEDDA